MLYAAVRTCVRVAPFPIKDLELVERRVQATERRRKSAQMKMLSTTKAMLKAFHRNLNEKLAELLGDEQFTWPELAISDIEGSPADFQQQQVCNELAATVLVSWSPLLHVPFRRTSFGKRSFSTAAPSVCNSLPVFVQNCDTLTLFESRLKAHLFSSVYAS